jgi:serine/threonine protein kinase
LGEPTGWSREFELKTIGKYEITAEIGRGAMGEVYKARDPLIGRMVALKVITSGLTNKPELLERFYQEARSAGALQHPNIVTVYELGKEGELPFIAMEFLGGDSLEKMIARQEPLPLAKKVGYIIQICRALEYAHKHGVVHRDIKPGNIMGTTEGTVKVVDFGIARLVDASKTQTGTLIGTLGYMSPQQLRGEHADERSDIWAVGVLFYELLCYKRPFQGDNPAALMMSIISKEPLPLMGSGADCTSEVETIIFRMLQKEAIDRYQSMEEVLLDLDPVLRQLQRERVDDLVSESQKLVDAGDLKTAQQLLREALHADSSHTEAKALLDKVSRELRRQQVLPRVKEQIDKAREKLDAGRFQEAKAEAQAALQLDSTYQPAREMLAEVEGAVNRVREIDKKLRVSKQHVAEGSLTDADRQLDDVLALDADNAQAQELRRQIREEVARREQRKQQAEAIRQARELWSQQRYAECIAQLLELQKQAPDNTEVAKLLETARNDQAEAEKQKKLAEARGLLGNQKYEQARNVLLALQKGFPQDVAVENLLRLAQEEQSIEARRQRLQQDLGKLRALVNEGKHAEALKSGELLLTEFPDEFELAELVKFARAEAARAEQARRLEQAIRTARDLMAKGSFDQAARAAEKALAEFPGNADLSSLRADARKQQQEKERREQLEKRIREVKTKITRDELTDAIELAKETIATLGPDTNVAELLQTAEVERKQRAKKKEQDQKVDNARSLLDAGKVFEATQIIDQALATQLLDAADPRVKTILVDVEKKKKVDAARTLLDSGKVSEATQIIDQALATQLLDAADPRVKTLLVEVEKKKQEMAAAPPAPPAAREPEKKEEAPSATVFSATSISGAVVPPAETKPAAPPPPAAPKPAPPTETKAKGKAAAPPAPAKGRAPSVEPKQETPQKEARPAPSAAPEPKREAAKAPPKKEVPAAVAAAQPGSKKGLIIAVAGIAIAAAVGAGIYFTSSGGKTTAPASATQPAATTSNPPSQPAANPPSEAPTTSTPPATSAEQPSRQPAEEARKASESRPTPVAPKAANKPAPPPVVAKPGVSAADQLQQLLKVYNAGTDDPAALRQLQEQFRALEKTGGSVGREARLYAEKRIPRDLQDLESTAAAPLPQQAQQQKAAPSAAAPTRRFLWVVSVDSSSVGGVQIQDHPLPTELVAQAAARHDQFQLQLSVNAEGRVTGGRILSGDQGIGRQLVKEAAGSWHFSAPGSKASVKLSVQF